MKGYLSTAVTLFVLTGLSASLLARRFDPVPFQGAEAKQDETVSPAVQANEGFALHFLRDLVALQELYKWNAGSDVPGNFAELLATFQDEAPPPIPRDFQLTSNDHGSINGYHFQLLLSPDRLDFCAYAWPDKAGTTGAASFFLFDGKVYRTLADYSGANSGPKPEAAFRGQAFQPAAMSGPGPSHDKNLWEEVHGSE